MRLSWTSLVWEEVTLQRFTYIRTATARGRPPSQSLLNTCHRLVIHQILRCSHTESLDIQYETVQAYVDKPTKWNMSTLPLLSRCRRLAWSCDHTNALSTVQHGQYTMKRRSISKFGNVTLIIPTASLLRQRPFPLTVVLFSHEFPFYASGSSLFAFRKIYP